MTRLISNLSKYLAVLLSFTVAFVSASGAVYAYDAHPPATDTGTQVCVNPYYEDIVSDEDIATALPAAEHGTFSYTSPRFYSQSAPTAVPTPDEAAATVRDNMIARNTSFSISFKSAENNLSGLMSTILQKAISEEYATSPSAGDYLAWHFSGYSYSGTITATDGGYLYNVNIAASYYTTAEQEQAVTAAVAGALTSMNIASLSSYDKVKAIYDYVCKSCNYDSSPLTDDYTRFSAYGAIGKGSAVCQGYTSLFYRMCREAGIGCKVITGANHSWNIVQIDGVYYCVDATWDDNYYNAGLAYTYFLKCASHFADHAPDAQYTTGAFTASYPLAADCYSDTYAQAQQPHTEAQEQPEAQAPTPVNTKVTVNTPQHKAAVSSSQTIARPPNVKKTTLKTAKAKRKGFTVSWAKQSAGDGYEIQYSTSKKFTAKTTKKVTVSKNGTTSKTISKLKGNKKYYIRVRAYKKYNGKMYYSSWSNIKNVTTKK